MTALSSDKGLKLSSALFAVLWTAFMLVWSPVALTLAAVAITSLAGVLAGVLYYYGTKFVLRFVAQ
jgi:hypothetical protein